MKSNRNIGQIGPQGGNPLQFSHREDILTDPAIQDMLRMAYPQPILDHYCSTAHKLVWLKPVLLSEDPARYGIRSCVSEWHHRCDCLSFVGANGGGGGGTGGHSGFTCDKLFGPEPDILADDWWDDRKTNWKSSADFGRFAAWAFSDAYLRCFLRANPRCSERIADAPVTRQALFAEMRAVLGTPVFYPGLSFQDITAAAGEEIIYGVLPRNFMAGFQNRQPGRVHRLQRVDASHAGGSHDDLPVDFPHRMDGVWLGRCRNIGGDIPGPYFFMAIGRPKNGVFRVNRLTAFPIFLDETTGVICSVDSIKERGYVARLVGKQISSIFKPLLLSHLDVLTTECFPAHQASFGLRFDNVVLRKGVFRITEVLGLNTIEYLEDAVSKVERIDLLRDSLKAIELALVVEDRVGQYTRITPEQLRSRLLESRFSISHDEVVARLE
jgi:hypothetical protein